MTTKPQRVLDPVCGMTVDVAAAEADGRTLERDGRIYAFCRDGCRRAFLEDPATYVAAAEDAGAADREHAAGHADGEGHAHAAEGGAGAAAGAGSAVGTLVIDEGMRRWYESCSCCLSDAYPDIKAALDAERAAAKMAPVDPGICEVAEAVEPAPATSTPA